MITKPCAVALEWWLRGQGKFAGANIQTRSDDGAVYAITHWDANGVPQPTDDEVMDIVEQYEATLEPEV